MIGQKGFAVAGLTACALALGAIAADGQGAASGQGLGEQGATLAAYKGLPLPDQGQQSAQDIGGMVGAIVTLPSEDQNYSMTLNEAKSKTSLKVDAAAKEKILKLTDAANVVKGSWTITAATSPAELEKISVEIASGMGLDADVLKSAATDMTDGAK